MNTNAEKLNTLLTVASEMLEQEELTLDQYKKIVAAAEVTFKDIKGFVPEIAQWVAGLLQADSASSYNKKLKELLNAYLESADADDQARRTEIVQFVNSLHLLFRNLSGYHRTKLVEQLIKLR